jgi:hypothetical protein
MKTKSFLRLLFSILVLATTFCCKKEVTNLTKIVSEKPKQVQGIWVDYIIGEPPMIHEFDGIDTLVKKWKINYTRILAGCERSDSVIEIEKKYEIANQIYFKKLESKLGKNWKQKFDLELKKLDSLNRKLKK